MNTKAPEIHKTAKFGQIWVRGETKRDWDALKSEYMKKHGATITDDTVIRTLLDGITVADLPAPEEGA